VVAKDGSPGDGKHYKANVDLLMAIDAVELFALQVFDGILQDGMDVAGKNLCGGPARLSIRVADTGIGMTSEAQSRVFNAFSQGRHAEEGSHRYEGLGLGLSISRMLVELHSGEIRAESAGPGRGLAQLSCVQMFDEAGELIIGVHEHFYQVGSLRRLRSVSPSETGR
jgi:signal transduction histidine kinase